MEDTFKVDFYDEDSFIVYYIGNNIYETEEGYKTLFKYINDKLIKRYNYYIHGFYDVFVYNNKNTYIIDFNYVDDFGRKDFDITLFLNSNILYEFDDYDLFNGKKILYNDKYYIDIDSVFNDIRLFEYGRLLFGKDADTILKKGKLIS